MTIYVDRLLDGMPRANCSNMLRARAVLRRQNTQGLNEAGAVRDNDSFDKIPNSRCCSMRFRERFGALIRKRSSGEQGKIRGLRLHSFSTVAALGQSCRHLTALADLSIPASCAWADLREGLGVLRSDLKLKDCHIRIQMLVEYDAS